jgi:hypothetical protein
MNNVFDVTRVCKPKEDVSNRKNLLLTAIFCTYRSEPQIKGKLNSGVSYAVCRQR